jgi:hypothetical protein
VCGTTLRNTAILVRFLANLSGRGMERVPARIKDGSLLWGQPERFMCVLGGMLAVMGAVYKALICLLNGSVAHVFFTCVV